MAIKVSISFKDSEMDLYNFLKNQLSPSIYLKELIKKEMLEKKPTSQQNSEFDLDF